MVCALNNNNNNNNTQYYVDPLQLCIVEVIAIVVVVVVVVVEIVVVVVVVVVVLGVMAVAVEVVVVVVVMASIAYRPYIAMLMDITWRVVIETSSRGNLSYTARARGNKTRLVDGLCRLETDCSIRLWFE